MVLHAYLQNLVQLGGAGVDQAGSGLKQLRPARGALGNWNRSFVCEMVER